MGFFVSGVVSMLTVSGPLPKTLMTVALADRKHADIAFELVKDLVLRTLSQVADEARLDGESLRQLVDRYEIDFAWHVLVSDRMHDAGVTALELRLDRTASDVEKSSVAAVLATAAASQSPDVLMSFDNDVAAHLARLLVA